MIESLALRNFRCFETLELHGLKRVNVLVGRNSSGKTALLEAIFLAAGGSPELAFRLRLWRGMGQSIQITVDRRSYESLWRDLFHSFDQARTISLELLGSPANTRSLTISYGEDGSLTLPLATQSIESSNIVPIVFQWKDARGQPSTVEVKISEGGLSIKSVGEIIQSAFFSTSFAAGNPAENASRFSELSKQNKHHLIVEALREEFPQIENLSIEINAGVNILYASVATLPEKVPLGVVSGGVNKLVSVLLAIANFPQGVILVDEVENGFYHDRMSRIWSSLLRFCKLYDAQIFTSTHSLECLSSILPSLKDDPDEYCLIRTEKENGRCGARVFAGRQLESAIAHEIEVR